MGGGGGGGGEEGWFWIMLINTQHKEMRGSNATPDFKHLNNLIRKIQSLQHIFIKT